MTMERILAAVRSFPGLLELVPQPGSEHPEISWGDFFFYYAPTGEVPRNRQPFATIIVKDYPDDTASRLDPAGRWRLNIHVGSQLFTELIGATPAGIVDSDIDFGEADVFLPHPLYGPSGWVSIVNPGPATTDRAVAALREAHLADQRRVDRAESRRRGGDGPSPSDPSSAQAAG
jgi:hypothetical protein